MKQSALLPHGFQRLGVALLFAALASLLLYAGACLWIAFRSAAADAILRPHGSFANFGFYLFLSLLCFAIVLIAFSCEKQEDEMIAAVRKEAVVRAAYAVFLCYMMIMIVSALTGFGRLATDHTNFLLLPRMIHWAEDPVLIFLLYELLFRVKLARLRKALSHEESN